MSKSKKKPQTKPRTGKKTAQAQKDLERQRLEERAGELGYRIDELRAELMTVDDELAQLTVDEAEEG